MMNKLSLPYEYCTVQGNLRDKYVDDLTLGSVHMDRVKLLVCGASGVGKTELVESLKCRFFRSLFRRRSSSSNVSRTGHRQTHGIAIQQVIIPNSKEFSIWDFSGLKDYYLIHERFMNARNSIFLVVFSLRDPFQKQIAQIRFWLSIIKAKLTFSISVETKPHVVLVASFADYSQLQGVEMLEEGDVFIANGGNGRISQFNSNKVLNFAIQHFGQYFLFEDVVHRLDCRLSQSTEMRILRSTLASLRVAIIQVCYLYGTCQCYLIYSYILLESATGTKDGVAIGETSTTMEMRSLSHASAHLASFSSQNKGIC